MINLPNYFLADLPSQAALTPSMIHDAAQALRRNREQYLARRTAIDMINLLDFLAEKWRDKNYVFRRYALDRASELGFSAATLELGLDSFFSELTERNLKALLLQEFGHVQRLDNLVATPAEEKLSRAAVAIGPSFLVHIAAGNVVAPALLSIVLGLLVRASQFVKCARGTALLPRLFAHSLYELEPKLGACLEIAEWAGGDLALESALFEEADGLTVTGTDETIQAVRKRLPSRVRVAAYGHRLSFGFIARELMSPYTAQRMAQRAAQDVAAWNQLGCLSPHLFYVETGGAVSADAFAESLSQELAKLEERQPRGHLPPSEAAAIASRRSFYDVRSAHSTETRKWQSDNSTAWTVVYEADPQFQLSCLHRFVYVKPAENLEQALHGADRIRHCVSTVGVAAPDERAARLAEQLARWGATRIAPLGKMQHPSLLWRHDGRPLLADLVTWCDWEKE